MARPARALAIGRQRPAQPDLAKTALRYACRQC
jgi:hypothetical protein